MPTAWRARPLPHPLQHLPAGLTIASATLVLLGRAISMPSLERVSCGLGPIKANAAVCFLLAGVSLALFRRAAANRASAVIGEGFGAAVALIGTLTVIESLTATDWGIDRLLYFRSLGCDADVRMPPVTALAFMLLGLALALRHRGRARRVSEVLASGTALLTMIPLLGFLYGASAAFVGSGFAAMTPGAAAIFTLLCAGFFLSYPELHRSAPLHSSNPESAALRRLMLATFLWPTIGGWALVGGVRVGLYDVPFGTAILVTLGFAVFAALILRDARDLNAVRRTREEAESRFRDLVEFSPDGILTVDRSGLIRVANAQAEELFGHSRTELVGQSIETLLPARFRAQHAADRTQFQGHPRVRRMAEGRQLTALRKDGREFPVEVSLSPLQGDEEAMVIATVRDVTERYEVERALRRSEEKYRMVVESASEVFYQVSVSDDPLEGRVEFVSPQCEMVTGHRPQEFMADPRLWVESIHPDDRLSLSESTQSILTSRRVATRYYRIRDSVGAYHSMADRVVPLVDAEGRVNGYQGTARDITEGIRADEDRQRLQNQLDQAHKMEAVGRLAGGVAHDFNNILTVIVGNCELALSQLDPASSVARDLMEVAEAGRRAADLTRQLLASGRQQIIAPRALNLNAQLRNLEHMLRRTISEDVDLTFVFAANLWPVRLDPSQVAQVIINLSVNARDAMPNGGSLTVETANVTLDDTHAAAHVGFVPGDYVALTVSDTGSGMDQATREHAFEPFFTTKPEGKGSGLGLATIFGIVKQNNGFVNIYSEPGRGTSIKIHVPRYHCEEQEAPATEATTATGGYETVLLVEDNDQLRRLARRFLKRLGYKVLAAAGASAALEICEKSESRIHLLLTDVVMPTMNGTELSARITSLKPGIGTLFMSGYPTSVISHRGLLHEGIHYLQKPFDLNALARAVRETLAPARS
jgi:PAS domain S-box-containing protein